MPVCPTPGCPTLTPGGYCPTHAKPRLRSPLEERHRGNRETRRWYRTARWRQLRRQVLVEQAYQCANPACRQVLVEQDVDHIEPHRDNPSLFWDRANLQGLCRPCHSRKTIGEQYVRPVTVVCGPPSSGKTYYVNRRRRPGDLVWDLDALADTLAQTPTYPRPPHVISCLCALRVALLHWLETASGVTAYVIITNAQEAETLARTLHATVVTCAYPHLPDVRSP